MGLNWMSVAAIETRRSILLTGWCVLAAIVLALVIAVGVSVGRAGHPAAECLYAISNRTGLTAEPLNRIYESVIWGFPPQPRAGRRLLRRRPRYLRRRAAKPAEKCPRRTLRPRRVSCRGLHRRGIDRGAGPWRRCDSPRPGSAGAPSALGLCRLAD